MWQWKPAKPSVSDLATRSAASRAAPLATVKPNFESSAPVAMYSCVCASTPGVTRTSTRGAGQPSATSASSRSSSSKESATMRPTSDSSAVRSSASDLLLPWNTMRAGGNPARERDVQLAAGGDVEVQALARRPAAPSRCTGTPCPRTTPPRHRTRRRTRGSAPAARPRRRRTAACRSSAARPARSHPPTCRRPSVDRGAARQQA